MGEAIEEREVMTPTVAALRHAAASRNSKGRRPYLFVISEDDLHRLREAGVPVVACVVYAAIKGAVRASGEEWVTLSSRTQDALRHSFRWWWRQTEALRRAGFIDVQRHCGRLPRFRLVELSPFGVQAPASFETCTRARAREACGNSGVSSPEDLNHAN